MKKHTPKHFYQSKAWRTLRALVLGNNPLCTHCQSKGFYVPATEVDHITPISENPSLMLDYDNLQPLCKSCHSKKTIRENRGKMKPAEEKDRMAEKLKDLLR